jgi:hypothetical protein
MDRRLTSPFATEPIETAATAPQPAVGESDGAPGRPAAENAPAPGMGLAKVMRLHDARRPTAAPTGDTSEVAPPASPNATAAKPARPGTPAEAAGLTVRLHWWQLVVTFATETLREAVTTDSVLRDRPPSIADMVGEIREAPWAPASAAPFAGVVRLVGRIYRCPALLIGVVLQALHWVLWRPSRLMVALLIAFIVWFTT